MLDLHADIFCLFFSEDDSITCENQQKTTQKHSAK